MAMPFASLTMETPRSTVRTRWAEGHVDRHSAQLRFAAVFWGPPGFLDRAGNTGVSDCPYRTLFIEVKVACFVEDTWREPAQQAETGGVGGEYEGV